MAEPGLGLPRRPPQRSGGLHPGADCGRPRPCRL